MEVSSSRPLPRRAACRRGTAGVGRNHSRAQGCGRWPRVSSSLGRTRLEVRMLSQNGYGIVIVIVIVIALVIVLVRVFVLVIGIVPVSVIVRVI